MHFCLCLMTTDPDFSAYELEDEEGIFEEHLTAITISLMGSPSPSSSSTKQPRSTAFSVSPPPHSATARLKHKLSVSNTPPVQRGVAEPTTSQQGFTHNILKAYTHLLPDAKVGHYSESHLDIHNPYSSDLHWELSSTVSPFVRRVGDDNTAGARRSGRRAGRDATGGGGGGRGGEIFKANYSVFWMSERRGITAPHSTTKVINFIVCLYF